VLGKELRMLPQHDGANAAVALSPDGTLGVSTRGAIIRGAAMLRGVPRLRIWEVATGKMLRTLVGHEDNITCDAFSPDGRYVLSGANDRTLRQWEVDSGVEVRRFEPTSPPVSVAYSPDGKTAVSVSLMEGVVVWDMLGLPKARDKKTEVNGLDDAWRKLASSRYEDRAAAFNYYCAQVPAGDAARDLQEHLKGKADDAAARAAQRDLIAKLDDASYGVRAKAYDDLAEMGDSARAELAAAIGHPSPEVRARVGSLLNAIGGPTDCRSVVAVEILATLKHPVAKTELERLAKSDLPCAAHAKALLARPTK
jgi:hypothetical protein